MTLLIFYGVLAIGVSFVCSLLEACLLSVPRGYVESLVQRGSRTGLRLQAMKRNIDRPLVAILTLNTVAHTGGAAGVGAQAAVVFGSAAVGIAGALMTLLILVVSEIIPKTLGAVHARRLAPTATVLIRVMMVICLPIIVPLERINRIFGGSKGERRISRAELEAVLHLGRTSGVMREREHRIASNVIRIASIPIATVLTPRTVVFSLPEDMTVDAAIAAHHPIRFARIPLFADHPERITGYVARFAIHEAAAAGRGDTMLSDLGRAMLMLPEQATVGSALDRFIRAGEHIAAVIDEYGGMSGIVTLEDLLESLIGDEIIDETDPVADMQELARRRGPRHARARHMAGPQRDDGQHGATPEGQGCTDGPDKEP